MSRISIEEVKHIADLSKIGISDADAAHLQKELDEILGYVKQLDELDTRGIEPTYQVTGLHSVMREDKIIDYGVTQDELLKNARATQDGSIKVPKVL